MKLFSIPTGNLKLDGGAVFGIIPKVLWEKMYPADEHNLINCAMRCLLVEDGDQKILFDSGIGDKQNEDFLKHYHLNGEDTLIGGRPEDALLYQSGARSGRRRRQFLREQGRGIRNCWGVGMR